MRGLMGGMVTRLLLAVPVLLLSACSSAGGAHVTPSPTPRPQEAAKTAEQIVEDSAVAWAKDVRTVRMHGRFTSDKGSGTFDDRLAVSSNHAEDMTVSDYVGTVEIITTSDGARYLKADRPYLLAGGASSDLASQLSDRWFRFDHTRMEDYLRGDDGMESLPSCIEGTLQGTLSKQGTATVDGRQAIVVAGKGDEPGSADAREYFAASGPLLPLRYDLLGPPDKSTTPCGGATGPELHSLTSASFDYTDYNAPLRITAPAGALDFRSALGDSAAP